LTPKTEKKPAMEGGQPEQGATQPIKESGSKRGVIRKEFGFMKDRS